jgi:hypothetical protein
MKNGVLVAVVLVLAAAGAYFYTHPGLLKHNRSSYVWENVKIEPQTPDGKDGARWGETTVSLEEVESRNPHLKDAKDKVPDNDIRKFIFQSDYYFSYLKTSLDLLIEKKTFELSRKEGLSAQDWLSKHAPVESEDAIFETWLKGQGASTADFSKQQLVTVKSFLKDEAQKSMIKKEIGKTDSQALVVYQIPPDQTLEWEYSGVPLFSNSDAKKRVLLFCDLVSNACFSAIQLMKEVGEAEPLKIYFRSTAVSGDIYAELRSKIVICLNDMNASLVAPFMLSLRTLPQRTEEPKLYESTGLKGDDIDKLRRCVISEETGKRYKADLDFYEKLKIPSIPITIVEGEIIVGPLTHDRLTELLSRK